MLAECRTRGLSNNCKRYSNDWVNQLFLEIDAYDHNPSRTDRENECDYCCGIARTKDGQTSEFYKRDQGRVCDWENQRVDFLACW